MKFSCLQENLNKGLQIVTRAVAPKAPMPILGNIYISAESDRIKLVATNLETTIITFIGGSVEEEGATTVPARLLKEFISTLPAGTVNISTTNDILHVKSDKTKSKFNGISADDYPALPPLSLGETYLELEPKIFAHNVAMVAFAAGTDDSRPIFTGVMLNYANGYLTIASTDGFRLSEKIVQLEGNVQNFNVIVPAKTLLEVSKVFSGTETTIKVGVNQTGNMLIFESEDTVVATIVLEGQYPDYKRIIPKETILSAEFGTQEFIEAVKLTNIFAKEGNNALKIRFDPEGKIRVTSLAEETGEHESELPAEIEGDLMEIAFNAKYLLDYLNNVKTEKIVFKTGGNVSPCMLVCDEYTEYLHIIMPMQL